MLLTILQTVIIVALALLYARKSRQMAELLQGQKLKRALDTMAAENDEAARRILERHRATLDHGSESGLRG